MRPKLIVLTLLICSILQGSGFLIGGPLAGRQHKIILMMSESSEAQDGAVDSKMEKTYASLVERLISRYERQSVANELQNNQLFVGIAGGPGSGKSTLADAVARRINIEMQQEACVVIPMDGFHYSRAELQSIGNSPDNDYTYDDLLARRGAPWTFDAEGCINKFTEARVNGKASLPIYSRVKSDPVEHGVALKAETKIVLLEGNYLLSWRDSRWQPLQTNNIFDDTWYIRCKDLADQRERLVRRHLETWSEEKTKMWGAGEEGAGAKADANDMLNLLWIDEMSKGYADLTIESI